MNKPTQAKPIIYTLIYEHLKDIARLYGYNLVLHGSLHRDLDLIAIPWTDEPRDDFDMIQDFDQYLRGRYSEDKDSYCYSVLPGGRKSYVINLNRGNRHGEWTRFEDKEYYLDISVTPFYKNVTINESE